MNIEQTKTHAIKAFKEQKVAIKIDGISGDLYINFRVGNLKVGMQFEFTDDKMVCGSMYDINQSQEHLFNQHLDDEDMVPDIIEDFIEECITYLKTLNKDVNKIKKKIEEIRKLCEEHGINTENFISYSYS